MCTFWPSQWPLDQRPGATSLEVAGLRFGSGVLGQSPLHTFSQNQACVLCPSRDLLTAVNGWHLKVKIFHIKLRFLYHLEKGKGPAALTPTWPPSETPPPCGAGVFSCPRAPPPPGPAAVKSCLRHYTCPPPVARWERHQPCAPERHALMTSQMVARVRRAEAARLGPQPQSLTRLSCAGPGAPACGLSCRMVWGGAGVMITETKFTVNRAT